MKFSAYKQDFADAINAASIAVAVKPNTPILAGIYICATGSMVELQCNNFTTGCVVRFPVNVEREGIIVVDCRRLKDFIAKLPDDTLTAELKDNYLTIESGGAKVELLTFNAADFPKIKRVEESVCSTNIPANDLRAMINRTAFAVAADETRPIFTGINFQFSDDDSLRLVATNTHRLAFQGHGRLELDENKITKKFAVPANALRGIAQQLNPNSFDEVNIVFGHCFAEFTFDNKFITTRLLEGEFPPTDRVIPHETATHIKVGAEAFSKALNYVAIMSKETESNTAILTLNSEGIQITANSEQVGEANVNVEAEFSGEDLRIAFNVKYLLDVLKIWDSPWMLLDFNSKHSPCKITAPDDTNYIYVVTPIRV